MNPLSGVSMNDLEELTCECKNGVFSKHYRIAKISALRSPTGKTTYTEIPVYVCASCGLVFDVNDIKNSQKEEPKEVSKLIKV